MYAGRSSTAAHSWHVTACGKVAYVICGRWSAGCAMQICLFVTLRMVKRTAIMHVHQQPIPLVEVALTPDFHESCKKPIATPPDMTATSLRMSTSTLNR